jgi:hypothetical protein
MTFRDALAAIKPVATRPYTLDGVHVNCDQPVVLLCRHAGFSNPGLTGAQLKAFNARRGRGGDKSVSVETMEANRKLDAKVFADHVVVGWSNVSEEPGKATPLSAAKVEELLLAIGEMRLDKFRQFTDWASDADNFTDAPAGDPVDLGK